MNFDKIPLGDAIKYICQGAGLQYRIEENAIVIADKLKPLDKLETRFYPVEPGFMETQRTADAGTLQIGDGEGFQAAEGDVAEQKSVAEIFTDFGVAFPEGATVNYHSKTSKLIVTNTPDNLRKVEKVLAELNVSPTQVTIESKFVEIMQLDLEELGFEWIMNHNGGGFESGDTYDTATGDILTSVAAPSIGSGRYKAVIGKQINDGTTPILSNGVRFGSMAVADFAGNDRILEVNSILGSLAFTTIIHALSQSKNTDVLSAPKITTVSGNTAILRMVEERYFPESWTEPELTPASDTEGASFTPSIPEFGEARDIGVVLEVTPTVGPDGYTIELNLRPQVMEFKGYDIELNYKMVVDGEEIDAKAQMPIIEARTIETTVNCWDGETVVLGGMIREHVEKINDKIPILGDLPLIGRLFQNKIEHSKKQNLLIFVTARLVNPAGIPIRANEIRGLPDFRR
ncbi:MAG: hypothetical protein U9O87_10885 [Verrucomicrobiota bacterium]|nr:hypothetical protein [Verrucomicrobiota bacterium]